MTWRPALALVGLALLTGASIERVCRPSPAPAVTSSSSTTSSSSSTTTATAKAVEKQVELHEQRGAVETSTRTVRRSPSGAVTTRTVIRKEAPVLIEREAHLEVEVHKLQEDHAEGQTWSTLRTTPVVPGAPPRWSFSFSLDNTLDVALAHATPQFRVGAGVRLVGPVWLDVSAPVLSPLHVGVGISARW